MWKKIRTSKRYRIAAAILIGAAAIVCIGVVIFVQSLSEIAVRDGYFLFCADSHSVVLCDANRIVVVDDRIALIGSTESFIVGETVDPGADAYPGWSFPVGFFVLNTRTGSLSAGLTRLEARETIESAGRHMPSLYRPAIWAILP